AFGHYGVVIILATIIVRTLAWPIYAKTNDLSLKMQLVGPEQAKLEAKYEGKTDPESMQRKQMEMMQLYKKYGIGLGGCLLPFIQFPIFIAFFQTLQRVPLTRNGDYPLAFGCVKGKFLGVEVSQRQLGIGAGEPMGQMPTRGMRMHAAIVGLTQIMSQTVVTGRQQKAKEEAVAKVPSYRRPQPTGAQRQTE